MQKKLFKTWLKAVEQLSSQQLGSLKATLDGLGDKPVVLQTLNDVPVTTCPQCESTAFQKYGWSDGLQRYRCKACKATFNRLTGTPLARLRKKGNWFDALESLNNRETLDQMQERLSVTRSTAVRWRKRFVKALQPSHPPILSGIVEADEMFIRNGQKGIPCVDRPPRKRGEPAKPGGTQREDYVCVLSARDRNKQSAHQLPDSQKTEVFDVFLTPLIAPDTILCSDGLSGYQKFAQKRGIHHVVLRAKHKEFVKAGVYHIQNVNAYHSRVKHFSDYPIEAVLM